MSRTEHRSVQALGAEHVGHLELNLLLQALRISSVDNFPALLTLNIYNSKEYG